VNDYEDMLLEAIDLVSAWEIPDEQFADAVNAQARLMAGILPEEYAARCDIHNLPL
jgi:hypothetical protein